jgi:hypothetical protein
MANLVLNNLQIIGTSAGEILNNLLTNGFEHYVPRPTNLEPEEAISWGYANWGTKWDMYKQDRSLQGSELCFITANGAADEFVMKLEKLFPENIYILNWRTEDDGFETNRALYKKNGQWWEAEDYVVSLTDIYPGI